MTTTTLTDIELATLNAIRSSDYYDGPKSSVWTWSVIDRSRTHTDKQLQGCLPRLQEKGLVSICWYEKNEYSVSITEAGHEVLKAE